MQIKTITIMPPMIKINSTEPCALFSLINLEKSFFKKIITPPIRNQKMTFQNYL